MKLEAGWVPVALSASIEPGTSAGAVVEGSEIVVWRDNSGKAHVWEDRCPHRGMRLSFGFVRGDHIACLYHGWQYDTAGQCRYIPAHPSLEVPQTIKVPTYLAEERYGTIWATTAREALLPEIDAAMGVTPVRSLYVERGADDILAALEKAGVGNFAGNAGTVELGDDRLLVAVQVVSPEKTAVHIVILGSPAVNAGAKQKHYAQWAEGLRFDLEHIAEVA
ncbi:Rieske (2Fe-2S) protein [Agrobacterium sp. SHOUNA12C]|uniref:Rieske domain-containing protein n=2 Tax=Rhizobium rhizogenes TaxID=359 RepID=A0AA87U3Y6_RHIRH|nr:Rieske (2Fe-2S) protein [Rhizobium rhizogenes]MCJ9719568.1 Rieske (2Fe-2S) protein [Agrobacterium sp. BETTINA12B]MCJ9759315.1 Rieske (2Fe-2S) protein [Agrobacterium sp. SHOUNA12C]OCJ10680.1 oxidoreductase [Agrobacterium sp. B131/95]OCJ15524.1 oxidoreductase [Agrobacterium sp. B133/95]KEA09160.1 oxidoreductase [Rhizobium rhizogenes]